MLISWGLFDLKTAFFIVKTYEEIWLSKSGSGFSSHENTFTPHEKTT